MKGVCLARQKKVIGAIVMTEVLVSEAEGVLNRAVKALYILYCSANKKMICEDNLSQAITLLSQH